MKASVVVAIAALSFVVAGSGEGGQNGLGGAGGGMSLFDVPTESGCRTCHDNLARYPMLEFDNPTKHHRLLGQTVTHTTSPVGSTISGIYECGSCHPLMPTSTGFTLAPFRDCMYCHNVTTVTGTPISGTNRHHHLSYSCGTCHATGGR